MVVVVVVRRAARRRLPLFLVPLLRPNRRSFRSIRAVKEENWPRAWSPSHSSSRLCERASRRPCGRSPQLPATIRGPRHTMREVASRKRGLLRAPIVETLGQLQQLPPRGRAKARRRPPPPPPPPRPRPLRHHLAAQKPARGSHAGALQHPRAPGACASSAASASARHREKRLLLAGRREAVLRQSRSFAERTAFARGSPTAPSPTPAA